MATPILPSPTNLEFVEYLYEVYRADPASVDASWQAYFHEMEAEHGGKAQVGPTIGHFSVFNPPATTNGSVVGVQRRESEFGRRASDAAAFQERVDMLTRLFRVRGHLEAQIDPLGIERPRQPELDPAFHGLSEADLDRTVSTQLHAGADSVTLRELIVRLRTTYCRSIGVQFMHIDDHDVKQWLQERMESSENRLALDPDEQLRIFTRLTDSVLLEEFIQKKYLGAKSFSLEGGESLIPLLDLAIEKAGEDGNEEIVLAMAHRGRLNVLANIMGKDLRDIFQEFQDDPDDETKFAGDVKYHLGYSTDWRTASGQNVHISLCFNSSHLEVVNPIALGRLRAKMDRHEDWDHSRGLAVIIHGDAAIIGEGVTQETLNLSELPAYDVGGCLHIVLNNQIGFTTSPNQSRSCTYCTDIGKMLQIPIFHVNGEDPEAVAQVVRLAMDFRKLFKRDVIIDMYCYRRRGHNETDEPAFTQPLLYEHIRARENVREAYLRRLEGLGEITREQAEALAETRRNFMEQELQAARKGGRLAPPDSLSGAWSGYQGGDVQNAREINTGLPLEQLKWLMDSQTQLPEGFTPHPKIRKLLDTRAEMARGEKPLDWGAAEAAAFASLLIEGHPLRMTGQDVERGTFSHRHANLHDVTNASTYMPLANLGPDQARCYLHNSPLSEVAVLGFEYGYSLDTPEGLNVWEAQFGDFANVAQVMVDQFISSAEQKWRRLSGLVMLLPHGFEGQGPEHSSARLERYLQLCALNNMQVCNVTTPAQYFHLLRRQVLRRWNKPLVVLTPKSLLRHPECTSSLEDLAEGYFRRVISDDVIDPAKASRVLLCSGKVYYDLLAERRELKRDDVAIIRVEQLYPVPMEPLQRNLVKYHENTPVFWVQEEPENQGAWHFFKVRFGDKIFGRNPFAGIARAESASPSTGSKAIHVKEQARLITRALGRR